LKAPNQWPSSGCLPEFRPVIEEYMEQLTELSIFFTSLVAEALGMESTAFDRFFDHPDQQHKLKLVKYPEAPTDSDDPADRQGVGPHKDSMLTSYLLQVSKQPGLQAQNHAGVWVDALPIDGTFVVAFGQGLQALTGGVCRSTTHRVLSPKKGQGTRYSVPFFQGVSYDAKFEEMDVPEEVRRLGEQAAAGSNKDDVEFTFYKGRWGHLGEATLANRVKSHPDVGERWVSFFQFHNSCSPWRDIEWIQDEYVHSVRTKYKYDEFELIANAEVSNSTLSCWPRFERTKRGKRPRRRSEVVINRH
jgi:isopenicillin N synthase-like dioxygenase